MRGIFREPLVHFFVLGALLFAAFAWINRGAPPARDVIVVDENRIADLNARFERTWQRPATAEELRGLVDAWIREEVLYREGLAMGLDRDDPVVRRRIAQKMDFLAGGLVPDAPGDAELRAWFDAHIEKYEVPARYSFRQAFFDPGRHGDRLGAVIDAAIARLEAGAAAPAGDATLLPERLDEVDLQQIDSVFGTDFAATIPELRPGKWSGPIESGYGKHLVRVESRIAGGIPPFEKIRDRVARDMIDARAEEAGEAFYQALRENYTVRYENAPPLADVTASR